MKKTLKFGILFIGMAIFSCSSTKNLSMKYNIFNSWKLEEIIVDGGSVKEFQEGETIILKILKTNIDKKLDYQVKAFINSYRGSIDLNENQTINVSVGMGTKAVDTRMEKLFISQFNGEINYIIDGNKLVLENKNSKIKMLFSYKQDL